MYQKQHEKRRPFPNLFYDVVDVTPGITVEDVRDAVNAAIEAASSGLPAEEQAALQRALLRNIVEDYAAGSGVTVEQAADALIAAAQIDAHPNEDDEYAPW